MGRLAKARGFASGRIFEVGDPVPDGIGPASWIVESGADEVAEPKAPTDNFDTRTPKALRDIAKNRKIKVETDDGKPDLIRKLRAAPVEGE